MAVLIQKLSSRMSSRSKSLLSAYFPTPARVGATFIDSASSSSHFNMSSCFSSAAKTSPPRDEICSVIISCMRSSVLKRSFSSSSSNKNKFPWEAKLSGHGTEGTTKIAANVEDFNKYTRSMARFCGFVGCCWLYMFHTLCARRRKSGFNQSSSLHG